MTPRCSPPSTRPATPPFGPSVKAPVTLALYGAGLVAVFGASFAIGAAVIPQQLSEAWMHQVEQDTHPSDDHEGAGQ